MVLSLLRFSEMTSELITFNLLRCYARNVHDKEGNLDCSAGAGKYNGVKVPMMGGFICTFSLLISLSITLRTSKFRNQFTISSKYFDMVCYLR
jgi:hypothetical protein